LAQPVLTLLRRAPAMPLDDVYLMGYGRSSVAINSRIIMNEKPVINAPSGAASPTLLFPLGAVVATPGALDLLDRAGINATQYLTRHQRGDFGTLSQQDIEENRFAINRRLRIFSAYDIGRERLWIITEADRSVTTILLPSEY
jgi:hypothetical protein